MQKTHDLTDDQFERLKLIAELSAVKMEQIQARAQAARENYERLIKAAQQDANVVARAEQDKLRVLLSSITDADEISDGARINFDVQAKTLTVETPTADGADEGDSE